ncbi:MAG: hypothetical protein QF467_06750, partial [SAR202 cluster bacterium]|nr:hypothetical protein [SAR202 cluster bacterium]
RTFFTVGRYGDTPETVLGFDGETETLNALGTAEEVTVGQLKVDMLATLEAGDLKQSEVLEQVSGKHQLILKALQQLCDDGKVERTGSGKRGDPYSYALVENNPGKEYTPVTSRADPENSFHSAIPTPIGEEGIETIGDDEASAASDVPGRKKVEL